MQEHRAQQPKETMLARHEAREIQRTHPSIFQKLPVRVTDLARALGLRVERRSELRQRARLEVLNDENAAPAIIAIQADLDNDAGRFAVAHEIGHAVLLRKHPEEARVWETDRRETFANSFATELLISTDARIQLAETFRALADPLALLRLASRLGFSPHALLTLATQEARWITNLNKIWLRVKYIENRFTRDEPKLRIVSAHYDYRRLYVPTNQSIASFAGDDSWLFSLVPGSVARYSTNIFVQLRRPEPTMPKFQKERVCAELSAVRLNPSAIDEAAYVIMLVDIASPLPIKPNHWEQPDSYQC